MKVAVLIARILMGLAFLIFGFNKVVTFLPMPMPTGEAGALMLMWYTHKWLVFYGLIETASGLMLLAGRFVPLGLTLLGPVIVNILMFHALLAPTGYAPAVVVTVLELFLIWAYRLSFRGLFDAKPEVA